MGVRIADWNDEPEIIRLLHMMWAEGGMFPLDIEKSREAFAKAFSHKGGIIGVVGDPGNLEAMIFLGIGQYWYTKDDHLGEIFNYVRPDCRRSGHAKDLILFGRSTAEKLGMPLVIGVMSNLRTEGKVLLYKRLLGIPVGAYFVYGVKWVNVDLAGTPFWRNLFRKKAA